MHQWVILWCEKDTSYSLVRDCELVCDEEHLKIGDDVTFFYDRIEYQGVVREMAGDDGYDRLVQRLSELNASNKAKESSFSFDRPRKCAQKFIDSLTNSKSKTSKVPKNPASSSKRNKPEIGAAKSSSSKRIKPLVPVKPVTPLAKLLELDSSDGASDDGNCLSRSPPSSPKPEDIPEELMQQKLEVKRQSQSKNSTHDIAILKSLRTKQFDSQSSDCSKTRIIEHESHSTTASRSVNNNNVNDKGEANDFSDVTEGFPANDSDSMCCDSINSDSDLHGNPRNSSRSSHGHKSKMISQGAGRDKSSIISLSSPTAQGEKDRDRAYNSDRQLPGNSGNSSLSSHRHESKVTSQDAKRGEGSTNSLVNPTTKGANDKGDELVQQHNKSAQRVHSNDDHLTPRRVSLFGHGRTSQTGEKSTALFESDNIGDDQHSGNHGVDLSGESDNGELNESTRKKPRDKKLKPSRPAITFTGKMLRRGQDDPDVVALKSADGKNVIYIKSGDLKTARAVGNSKLFVRSLMESVFSDEALYHCTLAGGEYRAGGKSNIVRKPQLDQVALNVILDVALGRQKNKEWKPTHDKDKLKAVMRQKLVDLRPKLKRLFEEKAEEAKQSVGEEEVQREAS